MWCMENDQVGWEGAGVVGAGFVSVVDMNDCGVHWYFLLGPMLSSCCSLASDPLLQHSLITRQMSSSSTNASIYIHISCGGIQRRKTDKLTQKRKKKRMGGQGVHGGVGGYVLVGVKWDCGGKDGQIWREREREKIIHSNLFVYRSIII